MAIRLPSSGTTPLARESRTGTRRAVLAAALALALGLGTGATVVGAASADAAPAPAATVVAAAPAPDTSSVTADPLPTAQINGIVWAQAIAGSTAYAGGSFTSARPAGSPAGSNETPRANLMRYNLETGALDASWNPGANGRVLAMAVSPDGTRLYVAGAFTQIAGQARYRLAAFDTATGQLVANWRPGTNTTVIDIKATNSTVYITGEFTNVNNTTRSKVAALSAADGSLLPFAPVLDGGYGGRAIEVSPDGTKVVVAGSFTSTNGSTNPGRGMAALDATSGALLPWAVNATIRNAGTNSAIYSLASDGDSIYGSGYDFGGSKTDDDFEGIFRASWSDGTLVWMEDCHGDTYSVYPSAGAVYTASHTHYCGNIGEFPQTDPWTVNHSLAFSKQPSDRTITPDPYGYRSFTGKPAGALLPWYPIWGTGSVSGVDQAGWDITGNDKYVVYGGEFTSVSGVKQQGLVRFAKRGDVAAKVGPTLQGGTYTISTRSVASGQARVSWKANYDADSPELTYELYRRGVSSPVYSTTSRSTYWVRPTMAFSDTGLTAGTSYDYRVRVADPDGNSTVSDWTSVTVASAGSTTAYDTAVLGSAPSNYWPLGESSGSSAYDWAAADDLALTGATRGATGKDVPASAKATTFSGSSSGGSTASAVLGPQTFSVEAWFRSTSSRGGKIVGFGSSQTGTSSSYDRHIYMSNDGRLTFGVYPGAVRTISSGTGYNDGAWHQVVGTLDATGMSFYVDGVRVGTRTDTTSAQAYNGYWRVGGDNQSSWPDAGSSNFLNGTIANVAVYDKALDRTAVDAHWTASGRTSRLVQPPSDAYGQAVFGLDPSLYWRLDDTSGSTASDSGPDDNDGTYFGNVVKGQAGALSGANGKSVRFAPNNQTQGAWAATASATTAPSVYSLETWFKSTSTRGGKLVGFGSSRSSLSSSYDRHLYMTTGGILKFGTYAGQEQVLATSSPMNDGAWHHVVATQGPSGMALYVDGALQGSNDKSAAEASTGYWRIGGDRGWEGDNYWAGTLDEVAVYPTILTAAQVADHAALGRGEAPNQAPTAAFSATKDHLEVDVDAGASADSDGTVDGYAWDFGDGSGGSGATASHTYTAAGTYTITLTVVDDDGATSSVSHDVSVVAPNVAPVAAFSATPDHLVVSVDASASTDPDGSGLTYAWAFGDGATASGVTASHTYAAAGTYVVTLTVKDVDGASTSTSREVAATAPPAANVLALDDFDRTLTSSWGTAQVGGSWTVLGGAPAFSVGGGSGVMALAPTWTREARLAAVTTNAAVVDTSFSSDVASQGGTVSVNLVGRQVGSDNYALRVRLEPDGKVRLYLLRGQTLLASQLLPDNYATGTVLNARLSVAGTSPTTLAAKVWAQGTTEPASWQTSASDVTAALQANGTTSLLVAVSSASTNPTTRIAFDTFRVSAPQ
ncbi:PKD domain-containing protein [Sediminihabitans luteus]|uniref:PKD domain-containing protein n=1 Tax=Sediminihabitans luteus TaxID=1138585 RepID=A0A2M9CD64_9CELL|nr:LamG-like jellyroll fold domain-containing protein [Sediminihabitans luteus]PJJ69876.1 PKD domain-containing protein [Sediminihabitans luteus]GII99195.1 hypothetical protein Slu03_15730 [Sediminihabitans luteus]